jgi:hypothetical protein
MKFIQGLNRNQTALFPISLEQFIDQDNEVRLIDLFVESLPLEDFGFKMEFPENDRPLLSTLMASSNDNGDSVTSLPKSTNKGTKPTLG